MSVGGSALFIHLLNGTHTISPMVFDGTIDASEIHLTASGGHRPRVRLLSDDSSSQRRLTGTGHGRELQASPLLTLFTVETGAPAIHLTGLVLEGPVVVRGSQLFLVNCTLSQPPPSTTSRALQVSGSGTAYAEETVFEGNEQGAVQVTAGSLTMVGCVLRHNRATTGAAMLVTGGIVSVASTVCENNEASASGGALRVDGGTVALSDRTLLRGNKAQLGSSIHLTAQRALTYTLPAPLGRWVFALQGATTTLELGAFDADYPFACSAQPSDRTVHSPRCPVRPSEITLAERTPVPPCKQMQGLLATRTRSRPRVGRSVPISARRVSSVASRRSTPSHVRLAPTARQASPCRSAVKTDPTAAAPSCAARTSARLARLARGAAAGLPTRAPMARTTLKRAPPTSHAACHAQRTRGPSRQAQGAPTSAFASPVFFAATRLRTRPQLAPPAIPVVLAM